LALRKASVEGNAGRHLIEVFDTVIDLFEFEGDERAQHKRTELKAQDHSARPAAACFIVLLAVVKNAGIPFPLNEMVQQASPTTQAALRC